MTSSLAIFFMLTYGMGESNYRDIRHISSRSILEEILSLVTGKYVPVLNKEIKGTSK